jgi:hypothetical protein
MSEPTASASPVRCWPCGTPGPSATAAMPTIETTVQMTTRHPTRSPNNRPATRRTSAGWSAPMTVATATVVSLSALKNSAMSAARNRPGRTQRDSTARLSERRRTTRNAASSTTPSQSRQKVSGSAARRISLTKMPVQPQATAPSMTAARPAVAPSGPRARHIPAAPPRDLSRLLDGTARSKCGTRPARQRVTSARSSYSCLSPRQGPMPGSPPPWRSRAPRPPA